MFETSNDSCLDGCELDYPHSTCARLLQRPPSSTPPVPEREEWLVRIIADLGYEVRDGDYVRRDGRHSPVHVHPVHPLRISQSLTVALAAVDWDAIAESETPCTLSHVSPQMAADIRTLMAKLMGPVYPTDLAAEGAWHRVYAALPPLTKNYS